MIRSTLGLTFSLLVMQPACAAGGGEAEAEWRDIATVAQPIVNGTEVPPGKYPWMVAGGGCTAALISPRFVLMAAHCFGGDRNRNEDGTLEGAIITSAPVRFGHPDLDSPEIQTREVKQVSLHPEYMKLRAEEVYGREPYDIAVLELAEPVSLEQYLMLPTRPPVEGEEIIAAGWGLTENGRSKVLRETTLQVKPRASCFNGDEKRFCSQGGENNRSSNIGSGDSGGPVFVVAGDGHMVLGTNSTSSGATQQTNASHATTFTFVSWVLEIAQKDFMDECALGLSDCDLRASCIDIVGGFKCECGAGYQGSGVSCSDVDECAEQLDTCRADQVCGNIDGSFACSCPAGQSDAQDGAGCRAICGDNLLSPEEGCDFPAGNFPLGCVPPESAGEQPCTVVPGYRCERNGTDAACVEELPERPAPAPPVASAPVAAPCGDQPCGAAQPVGAGPVGVVGFGGCQSVRLSDAAHGGGHALWVLGLMLAFGRRPGRGNARGSPRFARTSQRDPVPRS